MKKKLLLLLLFGGFILHSMAQQPKSDKIPDSKYGKDGFRTEKTETKDGKTTKTTEYYEVKIIDGKKIELLREKNIEEEDKNTGLVKKIDSTFHKDGIKVKTSRELHLLEDEPVFIEEKEHERDGKVKKASKQEKGLDFNWWEYEFDYIKQEYKPVPKQKKGYVPYSQNSNSNECIPIASLYGGYCLLNREYGNDRISLHGIQVSVSFNFTDRFPVAFKISALSGFRKDGPGRTSFSCIKAGPEIKLDPINDNIVPLIHLQAGWAKDGYKIDGIKTSGSSFTASAGGSLDWFFKENIGVRLSTEALLTRFNNQTQWHFIGSTGIVYKIGCR